MITDGPRIGVEQVDDITISTFLEAKILEDRQIRELHDTLMRIIDDREKINLILNFEQVKFLSSSVLGLLIRISKKVFENDGHLVLCNIDTKIHEIFKITRLTSVFDIRKDLSGAIEALTGDI